MATADIPSVSPISMPADAFLRLALRGTPTVSIERMWHPDLKDGMFHPLKRADYESVSIVIEVVCVDGQGGVVDGGAEVSAFHDRLLSTY